ncbi:MAG: RNA polymerase sigma factor [Opitutales bacterium]
MKNPDPQNATARLWLKEVIASHGPALQRYATRLCGDPHRAKDAVQDTFLRLAKEKQTKVSGHLQAWLFRVCRTRIIDSHRRDARLQSAESLETIAQTEIETRYNPRRVTEDADLHKSILRLVDQLPKAQREVVRLKFQKELSYREIAEITDQSVSHVGVLLHSALKSLRNQSNHLK